MWGLQPESKGQLRVVYAVWHVDPRQRRKKSACKVLKKFFMQKKEGNIEEALEQEESCVLKWKQ